jgi:hypothetical protein
LKGRDSLQGGALLAFQAYGVRVAVSVDDEGLVDRVVRRLPYSCSMVEPRGNEPLFALVTVAQRPGQPLYRINHANEMVAHGDDLQDILDLLAFLLQIHVAEMADDWVFLHAGVVAWNGRAIVLPGRSYAGKTTLVRELVRAGAVYYSDEYAVLDGEGWVHPFTRSLAIRGETPRQVYYPVETLGGTAGTEPIPVGLVVLSTYRRGARWRPERLSPAQGMLALLNHAVPARRRPAAVLDTLNKVVAGAPVIRIVRGQARNVALRLLDLTEY